MKTIKQGFVLSLIQIVFLIMTQSAFSQLQNISEVELEKIDDGFQFIEGPVWKDGGLLFSDIDANTIYRWTPASGTTTFLTPSGKSNGLAVDLEGRLLMAQQWKRRVSRIENNGSETVLAAKFEGDSLNSPNDLVVKSDGSIFFTDPPFGLEGRPQYLTFSGIFRINPSGSLQLLDATLAYPNGIAFSPNEKKLYVNDSQVRIIYVWDVQDDTTIVNRQPFASISPWGYADGMKVDEEGNLFVAGPLGVWVFDSSGTVLDTIQIPEQTTNCNWGDADGKSLYITADNSLYRARNIITNIFKPNEGNLDAKSFKLYGNYPNPFNPRTIINYQLPVNSQVDLSIYNLLGQKVVTLISEKQPKGIYNVEWNADGYTSGVYLCRLEAVPHSGEPSRAFIQTRKVMLLK